MTRLLLAAALATLLTSPLSAVVVSTIQTFEVEWSGSPHGNEASASALITLDTSSLKQSHPGVYHHRSTPFVIDLQLQVQDAGFGNETFILDNFSNVVFHNGFSNLDFTRDLVGQPIENANWGPGSVGPRGGDFNLFRASAEAPTGTNFFRLTLDSGEHLQLTSFKPIPEPSGMIFLVFGALPFLLRRTRR